MLAWVLSGGFVLALGFLLIMGRLWRHQRELSNQLQELTQTVIVLQDQFDSLEKCLPNKRT